VKNIIAERLLTPGEIAQIFRVDPKTVTRWAAAGRISSIRTPGGHRRFKESEVRALLGEAQGDQDRIEAEAEQVRTALATSPEAGLAVFEAIRCQHPEDAQQVAFRLTGASSSVQGAVPSQRGEALR
jgi:excisionase family DNA binding protein